LVRYGFVISGGTADEIVAMAREAEDAGWDGVFTWDGIYIEGMPLIFDPWVLLGAIASATSRVRIGAVLTPLARRRPWKVARETVTVDHLSHGRLIVPVGLGALDDGGFGRVGEPTDRKTRADLLDESLEILTGLWSAHPFRHAGKHYQLEEMAFTPPPVQAPRIPIWVVGAWPSERSMHRAVRYDGIMVAKVGGEATPEDMRAISTYAKERRPAGEPFDVIWEGETPGDDPARAAAIVCPWAEAGVTWWMEARWSAPTLDEVRTRLRQGPPRLDGA
jgi:alkanesulfonate monooxygenase SsuD/methylene tetrahydromethanopterin reductase-like flavin-dependent oxidoreductase (luciferase family)